jgi:hypothetical protein
MINGEAHNVELFSSIPFINGIRLLSSDDYTLQDINGLYLTTEYIQSLSSDGSILQDFENNYLAMRKG